MINISLTLFKLYVSRQWYRIIHFQHENYRTFVLHCSSKFLCVCKLYVLGRSPLFLHNNLELSMLLQPHYSYLTLLFVWGGRKKFYLEGERIWKEDAGTVLIDFPEYFSTKQKVQRYCMLHPVIEHGKW